MQSIPKCASERAAVQRPGRELVLAAADCTDLKFDLAAGTGDAEGRSRCLSTWTRPGCTERLPDDPQAAP
jgi:hypothetical protein